MAQFMNEMHDNFFIKFLRYAFWASVLLLTVAVLFQYTGHIYIYLLFSVASNALLYFGFRNDAIFFDAFIGVFFWLGFWLKVSVRICFMSGLFSEAVGDFSGSGDDFDHALLVATCGMAGLLTASAVRRKFIFNYPKESIRYSHNGILTFYENYRAPILVGFATLFAAVAWSNLHFGIYQRGEITRTILPLGINGIYKWLLLFGLASLSAVIIQCELTINKRLPSLVIILSLLESFLTNVSLLSRGMVLNSSALAYGIYIDFKKNASKWNLRVLITAFFAFTLLFVSSVYVVNYIRANGPSDKGSLAGMGINRSIILDRWVGIEGVMAVSSNPKVGWGLWQEAWKEKYSENVMSFYDKNLISSPYVHTDFTKKHSVSLPGILAFFFYSGSYTLLFGCMFVAGLFAALIEMASFKLAGNNLILCSLLAEVVAYRYANFGYVPAQSYLLFGTIFMNLLVLYFADKFLHKALMESPKK